MHRRQESGAVTAETAVALPLLAVVHRRRWPGWSASGITQVRALRRRSGDRPCRGQVRRVRAPRWPSAGGSPRHGSRISLGHGGGTVVVKVSSPVNGPAGLFGHWATFRVEAEAVAAAGADAVSRPALAAGEHGAGTVLAVAMIGVAGDRHGRGAQAWSAWSPAHRRRPVGRRPGRPRRRSGAAGRRRRVPAGGADRRGATAPTCERCQVDGIEVSVVVARTRARLPGRRWSSRPGRVPVRCVSRGPARRRRVRARRGAVRPRARRACRRPACCSARRPSCGRPAGPRLAWRALRNMPRASTNSSRVAIPAKNTSDAGPSRLKAPMSMEVASPPPKSGGDHEQHGDDQDDECCDEHGGLPLESGRPATLVARGALRAGGRAARSRRPCRAGCSGCRTSATARTTGSRRRRRTTAIASRVALSQAAAAWKPRSAKPAPPGWPSWTKTVSRPVSGCRAVETPPMSQRSQVANSGSRPIEACSAACAAPGRSALGEAGLGERRASGSGPPHGGGPQRALGQVERLLADHLAARHRALEEGDHLVGHPTSPRLSRASPQATVLALLQDLDVGDLAGRGRVVGVGGHDDGHGLVEVERR